MVGQFISPAGYADMLGRGQAETSPLLALAPDTLRAAYNRKPFLVGHALTEHALFELDPLFALCRRLPSEQILYRVGKIPGDTPLDSSYDDYKQGLTLEDVLQHFEQRQAYICINNPERDAIYKPLLEGLYGEIAAQTDPLDPGMSWYSSYIFISARDSVTPYHMDREMNFLLQVRGQKTVYLWNQDDSEIMSSAEKDRLLTRIGDRPAYQASFEAKAMAFELRPGHGVHHPFIAPHRVHTGAELSVSLALTFRTRQSDMWTDAHRFNARMRGLGLHPAPVGRHAWMDRAKCELARLGQRMHRMRATTESDVA